MCNGNDNNVCININNINKIIIIILVMRKYYY